MGGDVKMKGKIDGWMDGQDIYMVGRWMERQMYRLEMVEGTNGWVDK